jgi:hypothetical protein
MQLLLGFDEHFVGKHKGIDSDCDKTQGKYQTFEYFSLDLSVLVFFFFAEQSCLFTIF